METKIESRDAGSEDGRGVASARELLNDSLAEAQATVRGYDTKAQIVGVGYIFALGIVAQIEGSIPNEGAFGLTALLIAWGIVIVPILLFGHVLHPTRKTAPRLEATNRDGIRHVLYVDPLKKASVKDVKEGALAAVPINEIGFELLMVSTLREIKRKRFLRGLYASAFAFICLFISQLYRVVFDLPSPAS